MTFDLSRTSTFAALLIVLAAYALLLRPLEASIDEYYANLDAARTALEHRLATVRRIPSLERDRIRLNAELRALHVTDRRAALVERFLRAVAGVSTRDGVAVESVAAAVRQPVASSPRVTPSPVLEELPFEVTLRGRYGDVIRAVRDLGAGDAPAQLSLASLGDADRHLGETPLLNATLHVTLLREPDDATPHNVHPL